MFRFDDKSDEMKNARSSISETLNQGMIEREGERTDVSCQKKRKLKCCT